MSTPMPPDNLNEIGVLKRREIEARILMPVLEALSLVEGFNPAVKLTRTQTVMEGASHCEFRFELRRPTSAPQNASPR